MATGRGTHSGLFFGFILILLGVVFLLGNFGLLPHFEATLIVGAAFALGGLAFIGGFLFNHRSWGLLIPAFTMMGLGTLIGLDSIAPGAQELWGGSIFLGSIGLAFLAILPFQHGQWWPLIPAGSLFTLAGVAALGTHGLSGDFVAAVLFLGLAATFVLVFLYGEGASLTPAGAKAGIAPTRWAVIPTACLLGMSLIAFIGFGRFFNVFWPVALILAGLAVLFGRR